ncbi:MAG: IS110 family transposase [Acidobacteriota bacterium]|nr:IS110 family transposase [Acidobacteriota bacterium]
MKKVSKMEQQTEAAKDKPVITVGLDLGDRYSHYCLLNEEGEVIEEGRIQSTEASFRRHFEGEPRQRIALECGTHSPWVSRLLKTLGHQVIVANARKIPAITASESKNDRNDAELLARFAAYDPKLLSPVQHRSLKRQQDLNLIQARSTLVRARTMIVNALRGLVKSAGSRLPACSTASLPTRVRASIPPALKTVAIPLLSQITLLNRQIDGMDRQIEKLVARYPEIAILRTVPGVGPLVAAAYVLTLDRPDAAANRSAGAFLGLRPRQSQSGDSDPQRRISKTGDSYLRSLLVQSAQYVLGRFGPDSALRRWA